MRYGSFSGMDLAHRLIDADHERFFMDYRPICNGMGNDSIKVHKQVFGRQDHTWVGRRRFYVWKLDELWILASKNGGVSWETAPEVAMERAWELWDRYVEAIRGATIFAGSP